MSGTKNDQGKVRMELISPIALEELAKVLTFGANKYHEHDWRKGLEWSRVYGAIQRHLQQWQQCVDNDPETGLSHLSHAMCGLHFLLEYRTTHPELDDRYRIGSPTLAAQREQEECGRALIEALRKSPPSRR